MAKTVQGYKRKQYLVAKKFQLKYVGLILLLMFATAALCSYVIYYTTMLLMGEKLANVYPQGRLVYIVNIVNFRILLSVLLVTPLVALIGIFLSHRIAGPIYRMEKFLASVANGDLTSRIILRSKDELITLADGINYVVESLKSSVSSQKGRLNMVLKETENLKHVSCTRAGDANAIQSAAKRVEDEVHGMLKELDRYKV